MSRLAQAALRRVRPGAAAITAATALLTVCALQPATAAGAARHPAPRTADLRTGVPSDDSAPQTVATLSGELTEPWAISFLPDGATALVTERHTSQVWRVARDGSKKAVGAVPDTVNGTTGPGVGNGGLLGVAPSPTWNGTTDQDVFFVHTAADETRVVRMRFDGTSLSDYAVVLGGIARGGDHNGGKIAFGPDGYLYVATGDGQTGARAQDRNSLNGKILRITRSGEAAPGNPFGNPVYSLGHRNPEGLVWDDRGRLWETEIGQDTWDELNLIEPGADYGWPVCEGSCAVEGMTNPQFVWNPDRGGVPGQVAVNRDVLYVTSMLGQRLWRLPISGDGRSVGTPTEYYGGVYGRFRAIAKVPGASELWLATDRRGDRQDMILKVTVG
ncbi:PQQ-dependent sugar dehydrogenase [Streptomyces sp. NPDC000345]|uniref:PQQ-dependent sugar dehydrogenase n=1 Tax=Streptomyces sp. NPDC000345 TaxID=3364537 RepID=UPI0036978502